MVRTKFNPAEYRQKLEKKLNIARKSGFNYNVYFEQNDEFIEHSQDVTTEQLLGLLDEKGYKYVGRLQPLYHCMVIACDTISYKLLNFNTLWVFEPYYYSYNFFFEYDEQMYKYLKETLKSKNIEIFHNYAPVFNKFRMLKFCPQLKEFQLSTLPQLSDKQLEQILTLDKKFAENPDAYLQINNPHGIYRMQIAIEGKLGKHVLQMNTHIVLEHLLQTMSVSTAILDNTNIEQEYVTDYKTFARSLVFSGRKERKDNTINKSLEELVTTGFLDNYAIENGNLYFQSEFMSKHIRQQIKRNIGFYDGIPGTKQAPFIATFIDYVWWIANSPAHYEKLTISLETLLCKHLGLERLLKEHRLSEIAKILNLLRNIGVEYGLLTMPETITEITSSDVQYLLKNRTELHRHITLKVQLETEKEEKYES